MIDWDNLQIAVVDPDTYIVTSDENIYTFDAEQRMVTFTGAEGPVGPAGRSGTITVGTVTTLPAGSDATVENVGTNTDAVFNFGIPRGESGSGGASMWGEITGTLSDQTDLQNALNAKANTADLGDLATQDTVDYTTEVTNKPTLGALASKDTADYATDVTNKPTLGTMSAVNDAPSDNKEYVRKNGAWAESSGGGGGSTDWGDIGGTLSDQTDLQDALDAKQDELTFDSTPTWNSSNPVTSNGIYYSESQIKSSVSKRVMYFTAQTVSAATSAQIMRIPASGTNTDINEDTVVLEISFTDPGNITKNPTWQSYAGYITFSGTCTSATTANVVLGTMGN